MKGRGLSPGKATSDVVVCDQLISPLGEISRDGFVTSGPCENTNITGKVLAFKGGRGSTVGSYTFLELKTRNIAPTGLINEAAEQMVVTGAIISEIPMVDRVPLDVFLKGDRVSMNGSTGDISILNVKERRVATVYLMHDGNLLLLKRSRDMPSYPGQIGGISGFIEEEETPEQTGRREMLEECSIEDAKLRKIGKEIYVRNDGNLYGITPMIMETRAAKVKLNEENSEFYWIKPGDLQSYKTVPKFQETFLSLRHDAYLDS